MDTVCHKVTWPKDEILQHTDEIRLLLEMQQLPSKRFEVTVALLSTLIGNQAELQPAITIDTIAYTRLDILLSALARTEEETNLSMALPHIFLKACVLGTKWQKRFGDEQVPSLLMVTLDHLY